MMKQFFLIPFLLFNSTYASELSDDEIVKRIISESIMSYPGNCPCPVMEKKLDHYNLKVSVPKDFNMVTREGITIRETDDKGNKFNYNFQLTI